MIVETDRGLKLTGWYRGLVLRHEEFGKCKIYIPGVYPKSCINNPDSIPDAELISPIFAGSVDGNGVFTYPYIGATVVCGFYNEDQNLPFFIGTTLGGQEAQKNYATVKPKDAFTHKIHVKNTDITIKDTGDVKITTQNKDGDKTTLLNMDANGNIKLESTTNISILTPGVVDIKADTQLNIKSPIININGATLTTIESDYTGIKGKFFLVDTATAKLNTPTGTIIQTNATTKTF